MEKNLRNNATNYHQLRTKEPEYEAIIHGF